MDVSFSHALNKVDLGMCIRDDEDHFVLVKMELPSSYVDLGEALGLLSALQWVRGLHLNNIDFDMDSKVLVDNIYGRTLDVLDFASIINNC